MAALPDASSSASDAAKTDPAMAAAMNTAMLTASCRPRNVRERMSEGVRRDEFMGSFLEEWTAVADACAPSNAVEQA
jgi:hypothetical protein